MFSRSGTGCLTKCRPQSMGGTQIPSPWVGEWGEVVSGDVEEGIEEEVSDAFPQGGRLDQGDRSDALGGAGGVQAQHLLVPESPEVLPYRCGVV